MGALVFEWERQIWQNLEKMQDRLWFSYPNKMVEAENIWKGEIIANWLKYVQISFHVLNLV